MGDWQEPDDISSSESGSTHEELESELYSVLHYNSFSESLSPELLEKYNIKRNDNNEFFISLKNGSILDKSDDLTTDKFVISDTNLVKTVPTEKTKISRSSFESDCFVDVLSNSSAEDVAIQTSQPSSSPKKPSNKVLPLNNNTTKCNNLKSTNTGDNIILISDTDSDSDNSDVIIQEPEVEICHISSSSSVECLSDFDSGNINMILNTVQRHSNIFPPDDGIEEEIRIKWREVCSPSTWSESMKKYYNRASKRLKNFDCQKILREISGKGTWEILDADRLPLSKGPVKRCTFCRQTDHQIKNCPKRFSNCFICGNPGHGATTCPLRMCFNCGERSDVYVALCHRCHNDKNKKCDECNQYGHIRSNCPDTWRRYHSTTSADFNAKPTVLNEKLMCCNCGHRGHLYEDCKKLYWSSYPPTSFLVQNNRELNHTPGKRKLSNFSEMPDSSYSGMRNSYGYNETPESKRKHKKARWSEQPRQFEQPRHFKKKRYFDSPPLTPNNSRKKKKNKSPKFKNNGRKEFHKRYTI